MTAPKFAPSAIPGLRIYGIESVERALKAAQEAAREAGELGRAVHVAAQHASAYAIQISHVWTGALQESHSINQKGARAVIYPNPGVINPISLTSPAEYGPYEHARGGDHAFYARTVREDGQAAADAALAYLRRSLP
jgi:hypothetical protein